MLYYCGRMSVKPKDETKRRDPWGTHWVRIAIFDDESNIVHFMGVTRLRNLLYAHTIVKGLEHIPIETIKDNEKKIQSFNANKAILPYILNTNYSINETMGEQVNHAQTLAINKPVKLEGFLPGFSFRYKHLLISCQPTKTKNILVSIQGDNHYNTSIEPSMTDYAYYVNDVNEFLDCLSYRNNENCKFFLDLPYTDYLDLGRLEQLQVGGKSFSFGLSANVEYCKYINFTDNIVNRITEFHYDYDLPFGVPDRPLQTIDVTSVDSKKYTYPILNYIASLVNNKLSNYGVILMCEPNKTRAIQFVNQIRLIANKRVLKINYLGEFTNKSDIETVWKRAVSAHALLKPTNDIVLGFVANLVK